MRRPNKNARRAMERGLSKVDASAETLGLGDVVMGCVVDVTPASPALIVVQLKRMSPTGTQSVKLGRKVFGTEMTHKTKSIGSLLNE